MVLLSTRVHGDPVSLYRSKLKSLREAVALVRVDDTMAAPIATGQPAAFLSTLPMMLPYVSACSPNAVPGGHSGGVSAIA